LIDYAREMCEDNFAVSDCGFMTTVALKVETLLLRNESCASAERQAVDKFLKLQQ